MDAFFRAVDGLAKVVNLSDGIYSVDGGDNFPDIYRKMGIILSENPTPEETLELEPMRIDLPEARIPKVRFFRRIAVRVGLF